MTNSKIGGSYGAWDFDSMFRAYYAPMVVYATRMTDSLEEAEDAVQEVFCKLLGKRNELKQLDSAKGLLFTMLRNKIVDIHRVNGKHIHTSLSEAMDIGTEKEGTYEMELYVKLYEEVEKLPKKNREVMKMRMQGMSTNDIAEALDISVDTVRSHVKHGVKSLRGKFNVELLSVIFL